MSPEEREAPVSSSSLSEEVERLRVENEHLVETQRALEESRDYYSRLFEHAPVAWLTLDNDGVVRSLNSAAAALLDGGPWCPLGTPLAMFVQAHDRQRLAEYLLVARGSAAPRGCEIRLAGRQMPGVPIELSTLCGSNLDEPLAVALVDLRERERAAARHEQLAAAEREARAANEAKDQFIAMLSHELRTPLTPVLAATSGLMEFDELPPEVREPLAIVHRNVVIEAQLIDDLLDLARISHGKLHVEKQPVDAHVAVDVALETLIKEIADKEMTVLTDLSARRCIVNGDRTRLQQVFWNLLRNSLKFTPNAGQITVRSWNVADRLLIEVSDSGRGMTPETLARLFVAFEQARDENPISSRGLGLGLLICRGILEQHDGTIVAASAGLDKGSRFIVEMGTIQSPPLPSKTPSSAPPPAGRTLRILLVEDHEDTADIFERLLRRDGHEVHVANSIKDALAIGRSTYDLLLSDVGLPDGSGLELMRILRKAGPLTGIAVSGYGTECDVRASKEAGFTAHITKPIEYDSLREVIAALKW